MAPANDGDLIQRGGFYVLIECGNAAGGVEIQMKRLSDDPLHLTGFL